LADEEMTKPHHKITSFEDLNSLRKVRLAMLDMLAQVQGKEILDARRKRTARLLATGFIVTLIATGADVFGLLRPIENWFYDQRIYYFQFNSPKPSESIVHLDIDDNVLEATDRRWPWPREYQARVFNEIKVAGPKVLFLDITYSEEDNDADDDARRRAGQASTTRPGDAVIASAIASGKNTLAPVTLNLGISPPSGELYRRVVSFLMSSKPAPTSQPAAEGAPATREASEPVVRLRMTSRSVAAELGELDKSGNPTEEFQSIFTPARDEAIRALVVGIVQHQPNASFEVVREALLGKAGAHHSGGIFEVISKQYTNVTRARAIARFTLPPVRQVPNLTVPNSISAPILPISEAAAYSGFVDYIPSYGGDSKVRYVPLFCNLDGRMLPHVSLAIVCAYLDVPLSSVMVTPDFVTIPVPGRDAIRIPVRTLYRDNHLDAGLVADIPWFGGHRWEYMYDVPSHQSPRQHLSLAAVTNVLETEDNIRTNIAAMATEVARQIAPFMPKTADDVRSYTVDINRIDEGFDYISGVVELNVGPMVEEWSKLKPYVRPAPGQPEPTEGGPMRTALQEQAIQNSKVIPVLIERYRKEVNLLLEQRASLRADLRRQLGAKIILLGFTATGLVDLYPTPLHAVAPGVVAHGAMVNGMLTNHFWGRAPLAYTYSLTILLGIVTTLIVAIESPMKATIGAALILVSYALVNGLAVFDYYHLVVGVAGPLAAITLSWASVTLFRYIAELRERDRIQKRFSSYVDPELVNYIAAHPDENTFAGREKEMTVVFTDLEGFTTLSEKLKAGAVSILNDYVERMAPIIRRHNGFLDKFLGDGIMFEFNTVKPNPAHASDAMTAVLEMQAAMHPINESLKARNLPTIRMRAGINTGLMIVGDAGAVKGDVLASNFTVLGDPVNLAARLESANKAFGSLVLASDETLSQAGGKFAVRPMARLRVKGKQEAVMTYEPLCLVAELDEAKKRLIALTTAVFDAFVAGEFELCMRRCDAMDRELGESKFTKLYRKESAHLLAEGAGPDFDGTVTLSEK
jgi:class 3 adenylate cyclase/CHASE2 domain-containing sensor protein